MSRVRTLQALAGQQLRKVRRPRIPRERILDFIDPKRRVDRYWTKTMVRADDFKTADESAEYLEWRFSEYPLFRELNGLWGEHDRDVILDYGCGPGNDVVGFLIHTGADKVIGIDVSPRALEKARKRIALHEVSSERYRLIQVSDAKPTIPLADESVDFFQSQGVLHHTRDPGAILSEIHRVLKPGGEGRVMVYNRDSIFFHLYVAYQVQILEDRYAELSPERAFRHTTDGPECPISRCHQAEEFIRICDGAGFDAEFLGGYLSRHELDILERLRDQAIADPRLDHEHRAFLQELESDSRGLPTWHRVHAGIGGSYLLRRRDNAEERARASVRSRAEPARVRSNIS